MARPTDKEIMELLAINSETLSRFKEVRKKTIKEARRLCAKRKGKIRVLGISASARDLYDMARESSNSEDLLKTCLDECKALGAETDRLILRMLDIRPCKACYSTANTQCHFYCSCYPKNTSAGDDMSNFVYDRILWADAIIFATPTNNFKISTYMAAFIDRCISLDGSLPPANPLDPKNKELNIKHMKFIELTADPKVPGSGMLRRFAGKVAGIIATGHEEGASMAISNLFMTLNHYGMLFPPFSNIYAMSSACDSTYRDKEIVLSNCFKEETVLLARNIMNGAKIARDKSLADWYFDNSKN